MAKTFKSNFSLKQKDFVYYQAAFKVANSMSNIVDSLFYASS